jgi:hypothetical protein
MDSWKTCFNAYKISKTREVPGAWPPGPPPGLRPGPTGGLKEDPRPHAPDTVSRPRNLNSGIRPCNCWSRDAKNPTVTLVPVLQRRPYTVELFQIVGVNVRISC